MWLFSSIYSCSTHVPSARTLKLMEWYIKTVHVQLKYIRRWTFCRICPLLLLLAAFSITIKMIFTFGKHDAVEIVSEKIVCVTALCRCVYAHHIRFLLAAAMCVTCKSNLDYTDQTDFSYLTWCVRPLANMSVLSLFVFMCLHVYIWTLIKLRTVVYSYILK